MVVQLLHMKFRAGEKGVAHDHSITCLLGAIVLYIHAAGLDSSMLTCTCLDIKFRN